ncbi:MAG: biotin--[acetyl-CoA-carboxylase] ligase [Chlorobiales bacterium]|nr:biotin--[acetyl-CoA-carboxylase] ligase [Chlorobiales bacterium]
MENTSAFSAEDLLVRLAGNSVVGKNVHCYQSATSTNDIGHSLAKAGAADGTLITAEFQTRGKGRGGNVWQSEQSENITFSLVLRPKADAAKISLLPLMAALAVAQAIETVLQRKSEIKWPNDVLIDRKKICGILLESAISGSSVEYVILGIGVNVNQAAFPEEIMNQATSLRLSAGQSFSRAEVMEELSKKLDIWYLAFCKGAFDAILDGWRSYADMLGKEISFLYNGERLNGTAQDIDEQGCLIVLAGSKPLCLSQAEISNVRY